MVRRLADNLMRGGNRALTGWSKGGPRMRRHDGTCSCVTICRRDLQTCSDEPGKEALAFRDPDSPVR
jgi:hypothetical protein